MITEAVLEKRIKALKTRLKKAQDGGEQAPPPERIRKIRKRLKHNQRKLNIRAAMQKKASAQKKAPAEEKTEEKAE